MPFSGTVFANINGASNAAPGQTVQSTVWNNIFIDYSAAMTQLNSQYASINTNRNLLWANGGLEVWQRGSGRTASISVPASSNVYTADRWCVSCGANQAMTAQVATGLSTQSQTAGRFARNTGQTGVGQRIVISYALDYDEIYRLRGKSAVVSALIKTGTTFSGSDFKIELVTSNSGPARNVTGTTIASLTTSAAVNTQYALSFQSSQAAGSLILGAELQISWQPSGTAGGDDSLTLDDVSVEVITTSYTVWTPMNYDRVPFSEMLLACMRFYQKTFAYNVAPANAICTYGGTFFTPQSPGIGAIGNANNEPIITWQLAQELRSRPVETGGGSFTTYNPVNNVNGSAFSTTNENTTATASIAQDAKVLTVQATALSAGTGVYKLYAHFTVSCDL